MNIPSEIFSQPIQKIVYHLFHSNDNIPTSDNKELFNYYKSLLRYRHDLLHLFVLKMLGKNWINESTFNDTLDLNDDNIILTRTPDITVVFLGKRYFIDVSISYDINKTSAIKNSKYNEVINYIYRKYDIQCEFIHINCFLSLNNLATELHKIENISVEDFDYNNFYNCIDIINTKKDWVSQYIDKEFFELEKIKEFTIEQPIDQLGKYTDLSIDLDRFKEYNSTFDHLDKIKNSCSKFKEDEFYEFIDNVLNNPNNPIYMKYKDTVCNKSQFEESSNKIAEDNGKRGKKVPKPTLHILTPIFEVIGQLPLEKGKFCEQKMIRTFCNFVRKSTHQPVNEKQLFLNVLFDNLEKMYTDDNSETFEKIYNDQVLIKNDDDLKMIFKKLKKYMAFTKYYEERYKKLENREDRIKLIPKNIREKLYINKSNISLRYEQIIGELQILSKSYVIDSFKDESFSYTDFLTECGLLSGEKKTIYPVHSKTVYIGHENVDAIFNKVWSKTGINVEKNKPNIHDWDINETIEMNTANLIDDYLKFMSHECESNNYKEYEFLQQRSQFDHDLLNKLKDDMIDQYIPVFEKFMNTNCYSILRNVHYIAQQLLHFTLLSTKPRTFSFFNIGIPNCLFIVAGCYNYLFSENGKPFMCMVVTEMPDLYTNIFGKLYKSQISGTPYYLVCTNWRRLPTFKLTHLADSFYSVVSSVMNSFMSSANLESAMIPYKYEHIFSYRALISLCTNQRCAEILVDARYAYMSAFATHTNISKLLVEKFGPPYRCSFECWIIKRLLDRLPLLHDVANTDGIKLNVPEFHDGKRLMDTIGGSLVIPSVWGNYILADIHEVLDEVFVYVHTLKEPSNIYHEQVNALQTIIDFQTKFDELPEKIKTGDIVTKDDFEFYLMHEGQIGFSSPIVYESTKHTLQKEKPNIRRIVHDINNESISELVSTKAVISDLNREVVEDKNVTKRYINKSIKKIKKYSNDSIPTDVTPSIKKYYLRTKSKYYSERKSRQKVIETVLDKIEDDTNINTTIDMANSFILEEKGKVVADICIKSQYGSKREFYVINIGAKALARCSELFFKKISENSANEAISIAGDNKIMAMQKMLDRIYLNPHIKSTMSVKYVNGDCTKWSAAETMGSFISMVYGFQSILPEKMYELLLSTYNSWSKKHIQIPMDILNKTYPPTKTEYAKLMKKLSFLRNANVKQTAQLLSTQNFLQGMFNYGSSYKAVCCANYTYFVWRKIYPKTNLIVEHMEHSDDYVLIVLYENIEEFERFRVLHRIMMRLHGYNDSDRKTNSQNFFMEFVSQLSFNGVMLYPQIKKSKEVNINLPCTGYKTDCDAALSRVGECMRVGCNQTFLYFFERWHMICLSEAYSLLPKMHNNRMTFAKLLDQPIELFGVPDVFPIFFLFCRGNGNNYRLFNYGDENIKSIIIHLYMLAQDVSKNEKEIFETHEQTFSLFNPKYMYEIKNRNLNKLRKNIKWSPSDLIAFWDDHISYKFLKPRNRIMLIPWIKSMFYNRSFVEAYTKSSRTKMSMRISSFVKNKILKIYIKPDDLNKYDGGEFFTIKDLLIDLVNKFENRDQTVYNTILNTNNNIKRNILKIITKCDPTYSAIYSIFDSLKILRKHYRSKNIIQISQKTPQKITSMPVQNSPDVLIQYIYNNSDFHLDKRFIISEQSLFDDLDKIKKRTTKEMLESKNTMDILSVYNDLSISRDKPIVMIGYNKLSRQLPDIITDIVSNNMYPHTFCDVSLEKMLTIIDPYTNQTLYTRGHKLTKDTYQQSAENITLLYTYLILKKSMRPSEIDNFLNQFDFEINSETGEMYKYRTILERFTPEYIEQFEVDELIVKCVAFIKADLFGDNQLLKYLSNQIYCYSHRWDVVSTYYGGRYNGLCSGFYTHSRRTNRFIQIDNDTMPLLLCNKLSSKTFLLQYNIVLRILGHIREADMNKLVYTNNVKAQRIPYNKEKFLTFCKSEKITTIYCYDDQLNLIPQNYKEYDENKNYLPIMKTNMKYNRGTDQKIKISEYIPQIKRNFLTVFVGKEKIYTLPYWRCRQHNNISFKENTSMKKYNDIIPIKKMLAHNNLYSYIVGRKITRIIDDISLETENIISQTTNIIMNNRIYDFYNDEILEYILINCATDVKIILKRFLCSSPYEYTKYPTIERTHSLTEIKQKPVIEKQTINKNNNDNVTLTAETLGDYLNFEDEVDNFDFLMDIDAMQEEEFQEFDINEEDLANIGVMEDENDYPTLTDKIRLSTLDELTAGIDISSMFVEYPHKMPKTKPKRTFLVNALVNKPDFIFLYDELMLIDERKKTNMNVCKFLMTLKQYAEDYNKCETNTKRTIMCHLFYNLLCDTYITTFEASTFQYSMIGSNLKCYIERSYTGLSEVQIKKLQQSSKIEKVQRIDNNIIIRMIVAPKLFVEEYRKKYGYEVLYMCRKQYTDMIINNITGIDELLKEYL
jgi:hypothetical protein